MDVLTSRVNDGDSTSGRLRHHIRVSVGQRESECLLILNYTVIGGHYHHSLTGDSSIDG